MPTSPRPTSTPEPTARRRKTFQPERRRARSDSYVASMTSFSSRCARRRDGGDPGSGLGCRPQAAATPLVAAASGTTHHALRCLRSPTSRSSRPRSRRKLAAGRRGSSSGPSPGCAPRPATSTTVTTIKSALAHGQAPTRPLLGRSLRTTAGLVAPKPAEISPISRSRILRYRQCAICRLAISGSSCPDASPCKR